MSFEKKVLRRIVRVIPAPYRRRYKHLIAISGKHRSMTRRLGMITLVVFILAILIIAFFALFMSQYLLYALGGAFLLVFVVYVIDYLLLFFVVEERKDKIERILPDFLHLISSNIRAGQTPYQALKSSARDELGPFKAEIDLATSKVIGSGSIKDALMEITKRIDSMLVERVIQLYITSMQAGSHMAELMEETAKDISETRSLKQDLETSTKNYQMFILFTVVIGSPLLFSISLHLVGVITGMQSAQDMGGSDSFGLGLASGGVDISQQFIFWMSIGMIVMTSFFSGVLIGVFKEGNKTYGLRYFPVIAIISLTIFMIAKNAVGALF
ncbi:type II secretion system F family protein [Candidatus Woesearchaeota archaeon]|nr:type II secretion system F family protein [Candidatus Woesearchaeota archaeon]